MTKTPVNPLRRLLDAQGWLVLDGGLASTLEAHGHDLHDPLWSARVLLEDPAAIVRVHREFLDAGADCLITSSYQASFPGLARRGLDNDASVRLLQTSVDLAVAARDGFLADDPAAGRRPAPLIAASIGPYGAARADGSEYTGAYDLDETGLRAWHAERFGVLAASRADLLACETLPSLPETAALLSLSDDAPDTWAWFSFSCRDGLHLNDGSRLADAVRLCAASPRVAGVGVNCTAPRHIESLIGELRRETDLPVLVYPNRGENWCAPTKSWTADPDATDWAMLVATWREAGAVGIGGCCRVGPREIRTTRRCLAADPPRGD